MTRKSRTGGNPKKSSRYSSLHVYVLVYLILVSASTWEWQSGANFVENCRFSKFEQLLDENNSESNIRASEIEQFIALSEEKSNFEIWNKIYKINGKKEDIEKNYLEKSKKSWKKVYSSCDGVDQTAWSFLALSLICGGAVTMLSLGIRSKATEVQDQEPLRKARKQFWNRVTRKKG